jgi:hypothetical protein
MNAPEDLFERVRTFPDPNAARSYADLIGLDDVKVRLGKEARLLLNPHLLEDWSKQNHERVLPVISTFRSRPPRPT